jgi:CDP-paratose synthetase
LIHQFGKTKLKYTLVTGGLGFTGRKLVEHLVKSGEKLIVLVRSKETIEEGAISPQVKVMTLSEIREQINDFDIETVFHLATTYIYSPSEIQISQLINSNIELPVQLAHILSNEKKPVNWINVSTFMQHYESLDYSPTSIYAATKQAAEDLLKYFEAIGTIQLKTIIFSNVYGENDKRQKLINYLISCMKNDQTARIASGTQVLELLHVDDAVRALVEVRNLPPGRWRIPNTEHYKIQNLILLLNKAAGIELRVEMDPSLDRKLDQYDVWAAGTEIPNFKHTVNIFDWMKKMLGENSSQNEK